MTVTDDPQSFLDMFENHHHLCWGLPTTLLPMSSSWKMGLCGSCNQGRQLKNNSYRSWSSRNSLWGITNKQKQQSEWDVTGQWAPRQVVLSRSSLWLGTTAVHLGEYTEANQATHLIPWTGPKVTVPALLPLVPLPAETAPSLPRAGVL